MKKKRFFLTSIFVSVFIFLYSFSIFNNCKKAKQNKRGSSYNIIFIISDALRLDAPGCYEGDAKTPNIDWIARNGILFENAYSTAPCTESSAVTMFTGNYSTCYKVINTKRKRKDSNRVYSFYVNKSEKLLAEVLKEIGFDVLMEVENGIAARSNNLRGFEKIRDFKQMSEDEVALVNKALGINISDWGDGGKMHHLYGLLHYLLTVDEKQNFFLMKWFMDPHMPYNPAKKFKDRISVDISKLPQKETFYAKRAITFRVIQKKRGISDYEYYYLKELYKAEVESIDERVGLILKAIKNRDLLDKTFVIFTTDHGELFGEKGRMGHGNYYDEPLIHIPLLIMGPGIPKGRRVGTRISNVGLMPTLKDLLSLKQPDKMQGKSFKPLFYDDESEANLLFFDGNNKNFVYNMSSYALIMGDYKLITNGVNKNYNYELYNLKNDPAEKINIVAGNPEILKTMLEIISGFREENEKRRKYNLSKIDKNVKLDEEWQKTQRLLKSLGYIE